MINHSKVTSKKKTNIFGDKAVLRRTKKSVFGSPARRSAKYGPHQFGHTGLICVRRTYGLEDGKNVLVSR
jgi:hypothetical protein